jgi:peptidoglycan/xylan/chitin deacetylase (PgdA/CDA1 family)/CelD/BcsL family acetyltransferase involved in cellulose biosynthesis
MKVAEIREEFELNQLRPAWEKLCAESGSCTIFVTWEWASAWWSAYGHPGDLRILSVADDDGVVRGIAPLRRQTVRQYGQTVPTYSFVGDGSINSDLNDSDYLDVLIARGYEKEVIQAIHDHLATDLERGAVLLLNEIPATSPNLAPLKEAAESKGRFWTERDVPCATVKLPATWDEYLRMLQSRFRTKVRSVLRNLESNPDVQFRFCEDATQLDRLLPILFDLHARRWAKDGKPGVFHWGRKRNFYAVLSRFLLERGWLRLSWLEWKGQVLACQYGFVYDGVYSQLQEGYEPASEHWNLGAGLRAWTIREFLKDGVREYDFLGGVGRHKTDWGAEVKQSKRILIAGRTLKTLFFRRGPEWEAAARESLRKLIPEKVMAARRERLRNRPAANGEAAGGALRGALAACYFHSPLPAATRRLRDRYELSLTGNGKLPKISWSRRAESTARIFCYHRVNDQNDPFLTATPIHVFETQMAYLARHYRVLSITQLLQHLEAGESSETVVGITFDDGYRDNYQNAFPILKRYGLPATIFLTTGVIDSHEPLWFEQLATAVRTTSKESLDLEVDIPRRFWMRTDAERLASNNEIFSLLRVLGDGERRVWLQDILRRLGVSGELRQGSEMLEWEQIRAMNANGIDFGGHTVSHPFLSKLAPTQASWEISECKRRIEAELQRPVDYFAYPNGRAEDFSPANKELLRAAGYRAAVTTIWGANFRSTDPMELRRGMPWENDPALFASKLDWYQWVNQ